MALTKPKLSQNIDTDISVFTDPILVLHQGSTLANVDTGFLFNRANGLVSNVAFYWSESANSFVTAFTTSTGAPDANVAPTSFANVRIGTVTANTFVTTTTGSSGALNVSYTPTASSGAAIQATGKDSQGGTGYFDFLKATNTTAGATNANKSFRLSSDGTIEIVNSNYSQVILSLTDAGVLRINNAYQFPTADGTSGQALVTNGSGVLTFANVSGGGGSGATGFPQSTVTTFPTGDYGSGESGGVNTGSPTTDAFEVPLGTLFDTHEPRGSSNTVDLNA